MTETVKMPANWPEVLESRAAAAHLGDTSGTIDLLRMTADFIRATRSDPAVRDRVTWNDAPTAPKDGTLLRLLVVPDEVAHTSFHDSATPYETIGFNQLSDTGDDKWQFAGWDWSHDCITQGYGEVIGWLPFALEPRTSPPEPASGWRPIEARIAAAQKALSDSGKGTHHSVRIIRTIIEAALTPPAKEPQ